MWKRRTLRDWWVWISRRICCIFSLVGTETVKLKHENSACLFLSVHTHISDQTFYTWLHLGIPIASDSCACLISSQIQFCSVSPSNPTTLHFLTSFASCRMAFKHPSVTCPSCSPPPTCLSSLCMGEWAIMSRVIPHLPKHWEVISQAAVRLWFYVSWSSVFRWECLNLSKTKSPKKPIKAHQVYVPSPPDRAVAPAKHFFGPVGPVTQSPLYSTRFWSLKTCVEVIVSQACLLPVSHHFDQTPNRNNRERKVYLAYSLRKCCSAWRGRH